MTFLLALAACGKGGTPSPRRTTAPPPPGKVGSKPYKIDGKTYYPLSSSDGFWEEGLASWYGKDFHGKPTACGEIYDMHAMTAAHKTLPLGTMVRVTNLENGRQCEVRVNDRGPFVRDRVIDMSYQGAKVLDMLGPGVVKARVEALTPVPGYHDGSFPGRFFVQVGSFVQADNATRILSELKSSGLPGSRIQQARVGGQLFFRVQAGVYDTLDKANRARDRISGAYPGSFVIAD